MNLSIVLPFLIPAILMQVLMQAYFIQHCWQNRWLSVRAKALTIAAIAVFNTPAAAAYLFLSRPKGEALPVSPDEPGPDDNIRQGTFILLTVAYEVFSLRVLILGDSPSQDTAISWLLSCCFVIFILQGLLSSRRHPALFAVLPLLQIVLVMTASYLDNTQATQFLILAVLAGIINACPLELARFHAALAFASSLSVDIARMLTRTPSMSLDAIIGTAYTNVLLFVMVYMAFYMLKKQMIANRLLKEQSVKLEEMAALRERTMITGEIHDTVGHTLTSAIIAIEAGEKLLSTDPDQARNKLQLAGEQVRKGLLDIRQAVKSIQAGGEKDFLPALRGLAADIQNRTGLGITVIAETKTPLLPIQQRVLFNAVTECATNSLKHGRATQADLLLQEYRGTVTMTFTDNGAGAEAVAPGFGLWNMRRQAESIGGTMTADSGKGEGFTVSITLPTGVVAGGDA